MPQDDYSATSSGALKLKGVHSKISKPHKKKRSKPPQPAESSDTTLRAETGRERNLEDENLGDSSRKNHDSREVCENENDWEEKEKEMMNEEGLGENVMFRAVGKTEAERRHEEKRRRRVRVVFSILHLLDLRRRFSNLMTPRLDHTFTRFASAYTYHLQITQPRLSICLSYTFVNK